MPDTIEVGVPQVTPEVFAAQAFCAPEGRLKGSVKWFDERKGFGFIVADGEEIVDGPNESDIFVHYSEIRKDGFKSLEDGEQVEYTVVDRGGRPVATNVTGPDGAQPVGKPPMNERAPRFDFDSSDEDRNRFE
mmetsp:Transcript_9652/g.36235  ORF Transcript_9652/g.36235 Transcript_9652/m.36235 type:complete len:133 (-) Transcript_9652:95-493(-)